MNRSGCGSPVHLENEIVTLEKLLVSSPQSVTTGVDTEAILPSNKLLMSVVVTDVNLELATLADKATTLLGQDKVVSMIKELTNR